jgi:hypothetical protein
MQMLKAHKLRYRWPANKIAKLLQPRILGGVIVDYRAIFGLVSPTVS